MKIQQTIDRLRIVAICFLLSLPTTAFAIENGVINITTDPVTSVGVYVDGETTYLSTGDGVWVVTDNDQTFIPIAHPTLGAPLNITRPMKGPSGELCIGATFLNVDFATTRSSLIDLSAPGVIVREWDQTAISALDGDLNGYGLFQFNFAARFQFDGTIEQLPTLPGFDGGNVLDASFSGIAVGRNERPGANVGPAIWDGDISFLSDLLDGRVYSARDHTDGGTSFGAVLEDQAYVQLAGGVLTALVDENENPLLADSVYVTETDFAIINMTGGGVYAYFPGLTAVEGQALEITEVFSELDGMNIHNAGRPMTVNGRVFIAFDTPTGSYLLITNLTILGDANDDGEFNNLDIAPFVLALTSAKTYAMMFPNVDPDIVFDMNCDGTFDNLDIADFVAALTGG